MDNISRMRCAKIILLASLAAFVAGCSPESAPVQLSATPTQTATPGVPRDGTPAAEASGVLSPSNVAEIELLARWGEGWLEDNQLSADGSVLYAQRTLSLTAYDSSTKEKLWKFEPEEGVTAFAVDQAGTLVAAGGASGTIWILDAATGEILHHGLAHENEIYSLTFSEEGDWLVTVDTYDGLATWRLPETKLAYRKDELDSYSPEISIAQNRLIVAGQVFDLETGELIFSEGTILAAFSEAGFVATDLGSFIALQTLEDGEQIGSYDVRLPAAETENFGSVRIVAISDDHTKLAVGFHSQLRVFVFDVATGERLQELFIPQEERPTAETACFSPFPIGITGLNFSDDGSELTFLSRESDIDVWDLNTGEILSSTLAAPDPREEVPISGYNDDPVFFSPDGAWMASGENLWQIETGEVTGFSGETIIGFSSDNQSMYTATWDGLVRRYSLNDLLMQEEISTGLDGAESCFGYLQTVSPDGSLYFEIGDRGRPFVWDLVNGIQVFEDWESSFFVDDILFSRNNLLAAEVQWAAEIYDLETGEWRTGFELEESVEEIAISANGEILALLGWEQAFVWDLTAEEPTKLALPLGTQGWCPELPFMEEVAVSPDGDLVAADCTDTLMIWNARTGKLIHMVDFGTDDDILDAIQDLAFSPEGRYLAILKIDGTIELWGVPR